MTLDHVVPRHRGGGHTWENLVTACKACNHRKGGRLPDEARVRLLRQPFEPRSDVYSLFRRLPPGRAQRGLADVPLPRALLSARAPAGPDR